MEFKSFEEILDFAIGRERDAARFYGLMAEKTADVATRKFFQEMVGRRRSTRPSWKPSRRASSRASPPRSLPR